MSASRTSHHPQLQPFDQQYSTKQIVPHPFAFHLSGPFFNMHTETTYQNSYWLLRSETILALTAEQFDHRTRTKTRPRTRPVQSNCFPEKCLHLIEAVNYCEAVPDNSSTKRHRFVTHRMEDRKKSAIQRRSKRDTAAEVKTP